MCIPRQSQSPQRASLPGDNIRGVHHSVETISVVCITQRRQYPWCASLRGDNIHDVHHSPETISVMCITPRRQYAWCASLRGDKIRGVHHSAGTISMVCITPWRQYLWCASFCGDHTAESIVPNFCGVKNTISKKNSTVCTVHHSVERIFIVHHTAEKNCTLRSQNRNICLSLIAFIGTIMSNLFSIEHIYNERQVLM